MPTAQEKKQGGVLRYRTVKLSPTKYVHVAITRKAGPHGGRTVAGPVHTKKHFKGGSMHGMEMRPRKKAVDCTALMKKCTGGRA